MAKKIAYTLFVIIIIGFTVGYFRYNPTVNFVNIIPKTAKKVVRVNLRELEYSLLKEYVFNPSLIFESEGKGIKREKKISLFKQIEIPSNLFFYSFSDNLNDTWYSHRITIKDRSQLEAFFNEQKLPKNVYKNIDFFQKKHLIYAIVENKLVVVFTRDKGAESVLEKLLNQEDYLATKNTLVTSIANNEALVSAGTVAGDFLRLTKEGNGLNISGKWMKFESLFLSQMFKSSEKSIASAFGKVNTKELSELISEEQKKKLKRLTTIELDSVAKYWNGELRAQVLNVEVKRDTIVSYDYDDDFNKIEKKEIQEKKVPVSQTFLGGEQLYSYLKGKLFIKNVEEAEVLTLNPLFKTEVKSLDEGLLMFSGTESSLGIFERNESFKTKFILKVNIESFDKHFSFKKPLLKKLKKGSFRIEKDNHFTFNATFSKTPISSILKAGLF